MRFTGSELFYFLGKKSISGRDYINLYSALERLHHTFVKTNLRLPAEGRERSHSFNLLSEIGQEIKNGRHRYFHISIPDFIYESVTNTASVLTLSKQYFELTGGLERFLYLYARKSAGGRNNTGWVEDYKLLYEKSGSTGSFYEFKRQVSKILQADSLPDYNLSFTSGLSKEAPSIKRNHGYRLSSPSITFSKRNKEDSNE